MLISQLMQTNIQVAPALDFWQKQYGLADMDATQPVDQSFESVNLGSFAFQEGVLDAPPVMTRAGTYVYLNALVLPGLSTIGFTRSLILTAPCPTVVRRFGGNALSQRTIQGIVRYTYVDVRMVDSF